MRFLLALAFLCLLPAMAIAQDRTLPPNDLTLAVERVIGRGVQIYRCQQLPQGAPAWTLVAPQATLYPTPYSQPSNEPLGTHSAGPTWRWKDGSAIIGKVLEKQPSPDGQSIPWLLLSAASTPDSKPSGALTGVVYVRRSDTEGGSAPTAGCDPAHLDQQQVPYAAIYTFYIAVPHP